MRITTEPTVPNSTIVRKNSLFNKQTILITYPELLCGYNWLERLDYYMEDDPRSKEGNDEQSGKEATSKWERWRPCPVCHETELTMYIES